MSHATGYVKEKRRPKKGERGHYKVDDRWPLDIVRDERRLYESRSAVQLRGEVERFFRHAKKRAARKLQPAVGAPPEKGVPPQVFQIIDALDNGSKAVLNSAVRMVKQDGKVVPEVVPGTVVRIDGREFHRSHYMRAVLFRKKRTALRIAKLIKIKRCANEDEARKYLETNGWNPTAPATSEESA